MTTGLQDKASSGIAGLDYILGGGLPRNRIYLVKGEPGVGKTTLALQFLLTGAEQGEVALYITLSETQLELEGVAKSHGWSLDKLKLFELKPPEPSREGADYTMYHPSEVELGQAIKTLLEEVDRVNPARVVFDSLSEIRLLAQQQLRYRRQILALKQHFIGKACTILLLDDHNATSENQVDSLAHGVILLERVSPVYGGSRRRLEVAKLRGVRVFDGYHDFNIETGGIRVFPRLQAAGNSATFQRGVLKSGVDALDRLLGGGIDLGTATLVIGPAGTGKSALATQYARAAAAAGQRAVIYTFDESVATLRARAKALGTPIDDEIASGAIKVQQIDPAEMSPGQFADEVRTSVEREDVRVAILDSLTGYLNAMPEERFLLNQMHELLTFLGQHGVVTILVATQHGLIGTAMVTPVDISYLADSVILLRYFEASGRVRNAISVVKKRSGLHERTIREFALSSTGIQIGEPLDNFHGILSGIPTYTGGAEPLLSPELRLQAQPPQGQ